MGDERIYLDDFIDFNDSLNNSKEEENNTQSFIIAIDGFSSTGKSTLAKLIAKHLNFIYIDSGALYRAVTYFALCGGFIDKKGNIDKQLLRVALDDNIDISLSIDPNGTTYTMLGGLNIEEDIRKPKVSSLVSPIAELQFVRSFVDSIILASASKHKQIVADGRDIGTAVFPEAQLKIFMTASDDVRAKRRYDELVAKGEKVTIESVLENLRERDHIDQSREIHPLRKADDAIVLDNSNMTIEEELLWCRDLLREKFNMEFTID